MFVSLAVVDILAKSTRRSAKRALDRFIGLSLTLVGIASKLPWVNYDKTESIWSHQAVDIRTASAADIDMFAETDATIKDYDIYYIDVVSKYINGEASPYGAFYTNFSPVRADGTIVNELSLIGVDSCKSNALGAEPQDTAAEIKNCVAAAVPKGSEAPAGVAWSAYDTDYAQYNGSPVNILVK